MSVVVDISMSLDGFVAGPDVSIDNGMGTGGMALHAWAFSDDPTERELLTSWTHRSGAVVMGRRTFDIVDQVWTAEVGYGAENAAEPPCFVVTHERPESIRLEHRFTVVTDGIESAIERARSAAGDKDVVVMGGGDVCGQILAAGLADELSLHLAPVVLGSGAPLFAAGSVDLEHVRTIQTANATHLTYRVL